MRLLEVVLVAVIALTFAVLYSMVVAETSRALEIMRPTGAAGSLAFFEAVSTSLAFVSLLLLLTFAAGLLALVADQEVRGAARAWARGRRR